MKEKQNQILLLIGLLVVFFIVGFIDLGIHKGSDYKDLGPAGKLAVWLFIADLIYLVGMIFWTLVKQIIKKK